ncbi:uncharacterized protein LOC125542986 isoform X2 [Triticum urartu]|uniref:uncharacterized protein LOC125516507 isoform X2 n=1 Tax=Triticum urartu TaxID=4572 RepID=UPI002042E820|nr:uncharacterized protein LOC125516507 isoform X2 [Triticum urartu]XP_048562178.1 uncharacterized protein LOC125542972 isoform X2 [Triticum urartu]XP_048562197.1 uncharacterized protein LOC125542986 isoform X2 [Triticum urartu]
MSSDSEPSGSQSSDTKSSDAGPKDTSIPFNLHRGSVNPVTGLGTFHLEMPSSEVVSAAKPTNYPPILLEIKDDDQMESLLRMKKLQHENILAVHFFQKDGAGGLRAFVEPYTGYVVELFANVKFFVNEETGLVPSQRFQEIVSASLDGLDFIFKSDLYHGNFSWNTTAYHRDKVDGKVTLKLCNFEDRKDSSLLKCQIGDCHALAHDLEKVSRRVKDEYPGVKPEACCVLDDLACRLRAVNDMKSLSTMKQKNQDHVFFWDDTKKRTFCAYEMPAVWSTDAFWNNFRASPSAALDMPWNTEWEANSPLLLEEMEKYRVKNNIAPYNFDNRKDFLRLISGLYTHQIELKLQLPHISVDVVVHLRHPRLLLDLKAAAEVDAVDVDNQNQ